MVNCGIPVMEQDDQGPSDNQIRKEDGDEMVEVERTENSLEDGEFREDCIVLMHAWILCLNVLTCKRITRFFLRRRVNVLVKRKNMVGL